MNLLLIDPQEIQPDGTVRLDDRRHRHLRQVLNSQRGDKLKVGLMGGNIGSASLIDTDLHSSVLGELCWQRPAPAKLPLTLILALPRPKAARRLCRTIAELGVEHLILVNSYRVEKSYWQSPLLQPERIQNYFIEGLEQAGDTVMPSLQVEKRFKPFVEDRLPALLSGKRGVLAHPYSEQGSSAQARATVLAVGPEGGFIPYELDKLQQAGMQGISLGSRILRVETAVPTLIARLFP